MSCHAPIEQAHPKIGPGECVICHGGDRSAVDKDTAHVAIPADLAAIRGPDLPAPPSPGYIRNFTSDQLDALPLEYLRFINPGDLRAAPLSCGAANCHWDKVDSLPRSVMANNGGHYFPTLYLAGLVDQKASTQGSISVNGASCSESAGTVCELEPIRSSTDMSALSAALTSGDQRQVLDVAYDSYLSKNCNTCHQASFPRNNALAAYRSSGCTACHMTYTEDGRYSGDDPTVPRDSAPHPARHTLSRSIPTSQCATCHFQGGRIGLLYQGIREGGFATRPPNAEIIDRKLYGRDPGYYFTDEDTTNGYDETPPDVHAQAGMTCADCHVGRDVHGGPTIWSTSKGQVSIACEDCHGTVREAVRAQPDGLVHARSGQPLRQLRVAPDGSVELVGNLDGKIHRVTQVATRLQTGASPRMREAMGVRPDGTSHADRITCDTCHTSHTQLCIGCHVEVDYRSDQVDYQTGRLTPGLTKAARTTFTLGQLLLGVRADGRVQTVHPSQQLQLVVRGASRFGNTTDGELLVGATTGTTSRVVGAFRQRDTHSVNNGFVPFFQHTTSRFARACSACHPTDTSPAEVARIRGVYGFGTGQFMLPGPGTQRVDGLRFLDDDGEPTTDWFHPGSGPLPVARRLRAMTTTVAP